MTFPNMISGTPMATDLLHDVLQAGTTPTPVDAVNVFVGYQQPPENDNIMYVLTSFNSPPPLQTMGTVVALELEKVDVMIYHASYSIARAEAARVRYLLINGCSNYVGRGRRMLYANPDGGVEDLGRDALNRSVFMVSFTCMMEPGYV